jgi:hypothetical protein
MKAVSFRQQLPIEKPRRKNSAQAGAVTGFLAQHRHH